MEAIRKAQQVLKDLEKELKGMDSEASRKDGDIAGKNAKIATLHKEITELEAKRSAIQEIVSTMEIDARKAREAQERDLKVLSERYNSELTKTKQAQVLAEQAQKDALQAKDASDKKYSEY